MKPILLGLYACAKVRTGNKDGCVFEELSQPYPEYSHQCLAIVVVMLGANIITGRFVPGHLRRTRFSVRCRKGTALTLYSSVSICLAVQVMVSDGRGIFLCQISEKWHLSETTPTTTSDRVLTDGSLLKTISSYGSPLA
eukprot:Gb_09494 [translate_table: standard]